VFAAGAVLLALLLVEAGAYGLIALSDRLLDEPIRTRRSILAEQTARISVLLDTTRHGRGV
jgi:hypothetical protein